MPKNKAAQNGGNAPGQGPLRRIPERYRIFALAAIVLALLIIAAIAANSEHKGCGSIIFSTQRNACYENYAVSEGNASICTHINAIPVRSQCIQSVASDTGNAHACLTLNASSGIATCISSAALTAKNESYCSLIKNATASSNCMYGYAKAMNYSSQAYCTGIQNATERTVCMSSSYYLKAMATGNPSYCSYLNGTVGGGVPVADLLSLNRNLSSYYDFEALSMSDSDICYYELATTYRDAALCALLPGNYSVDCAYVASQNIAALNVTENASVINSSCNYVKSYGLTIYYSCYYGFAVRYKNATLCDQIQNSSFKSQCISAASNSSS